MERNSRLDGLDNHSQDEGAGLSGRSFLERANCGKIFRRTILPWLAHVWPSKVDAQIRWENASGGRREKAVGVPGSVRKANRQRRLRLLDRASESPLPRTYSSWRVLGAAFPDVGEQLAQEFASLSSWSMGKLPTDNPSVSRYEDAWPGRIFHSRWFGAW